MAHSNAPIEKLPSQFQLKQKAGLQKLIDLMERARDGVVTSIAFHPKVKYDIQIPIMEHTDGEVLGQFRIANVQEDLLLEPFQNGLHYNSWRDQQSRVDDLKVDKIRRSSEEPNVLDGYTAHPFLQPPPPLGKYEFNSRVVVVDITGHRTNFVLAYYMHAEKKWMLHPEKKSFEPFEGDQAKWMDILPFADKY